MKKSNKYDSTFLVLSLLPFSFSLLSTVYLYSSRSGLWLVSGISLIIVFLRIFVGVKGLKSIFYLPKQKSSSYKPIFFLTSVIYLLSSMHGIYLTLLALPINDRSVLFIPYLITFFIIGGLSLELF